MSHAGSHWACEQRSVPLAARFVLVALADRHCPDNGCEVEPKNLCHHLAISHAELHAHLKVLAAAGLINRQDAPLIRLAFEKGFAREGSV